MTVQQEQLSDEHLADTISDDGRLSATIDASSEDGVLEVGSISHGKDSDGEIDSSLLEEPFSMDDFDENLEIDRGVELTAGSPSDPAEPATNTDALEVDARSVSIDEEETTIGSTDEVGEVAEFRRTLSALSRQLEIDRLTFLYREMQAEGKPLPNLGKIASDIRGDAQLQPIGDEDAYSKRPFARLQGWIAGLSFGVGRRAKKFSGSDG